MGTEGEVVTTRRLAEAKHSKGLNFPTTDSATWYIYMEDGEEVPSSRHYKAL